MLALGSVTDLATALGQVTEFELLNSVCQYATVYPAPTAPTASLRRGRLLDAMLTMNDRRPVFAVLTDDEALAVGNELVNFLFARLGRSETLRVVDGTRMLSSAGISSGVDKLLSEKIGAPIRMLDLITDSADTGMKAIKENAQSEDVE